MSIGKALFVCGFPDVSVDYERLDFLALVVGVEGSSDSSGSREPKKDQKGGMRFVEKEMKKVGREDEYRL